MVFGIVPFADNRFHEMAARYQTLKTPTEFLQKIGQLRAWSSTRMPRNLRRPSSPRLRRAGKIRQIRRQNGHRSGPPEPPDGRRTFTTLVCWSHAEFDVQSAICLTKTLCTFLSRNTCQTVSHRQMRRNLHTQSYRPDGSMTAGAAGLPREIPHFVAGSAVLQCLRVQDY